MPTATAYRRAPLVDPVYVPLSDAAVHTDGPQQQLTKLALEAVDVSRMTALDAVIASKLGRVYGYAAHAGCGGGSRAFARRAGALSSNPARRGHALRLSAR